MAINIDPELLALIKKSVAEFEALPVAEQEAMNLRQRESWVRGEMAIGSDAQESAERQKLSSRGAQ